MQIVSPGELSRGAGFTIKAKVVGGKIDQKIVRITAKLEQRSEYTKYKLGGGKEIVSNNFVLSQDEVLGFDLKAGETKEVSFNLKADAKEIKVEQGGAMGVLDKLNKVATQAKDEWKISVSAEIEGSINASDAISALIK